VRLVTTKDGPSRAYKTYNDRQRAITLIRRWAEGIGFDPLFIHGYHGSLLTLRVVLR